MIFKFSGIYYATGRVQIGESIYVFGEEFIQFKPCSLWYTIRSIQILFFSLGSISMTQTSQRHIWGEGRELQVPCADL